MPKMWQWQGLQYQYLQTTSICIDVSSAFAEAEQFAHLKNWQLWPKSWDDPRILETSTKRHGEAISDSDIPDV